MPSVLIPHQLTANIYVRELGRAYQALGCNVIYGSENLLECNVNPDLIHLQWPEELYRWRGLGRMEVRIESFLSSLAALKQRGAKLAWTVHNVAPHDHVDSAADHAVYQSIIDAADVLVHHCQVSSRLLRDRYRVAPEKLEVIVPHGNYAAYPNTVTRGDARRLLGLSPDAFVYLHFGQVRGYKGFGRLLTAFSRVKVKHKILLVAGQFDAITTRGYVFDRIFLAWKKRTIRGLLLNLREVPSEDVQLYFNASDCLVLGHGGGLNSGVAILGMTFGKVVVGPRIGCVEWVLEQGSNLLYEPGSLKALVHAMTAATSVNADECARKNTRAAESWKWTVFCTVVMSTLGIGTQNVTARISG
jgi:glycosyltransferase involved in cell wall biosynthesis